jgi:hypothetical protein
MANPQSAIRDPRSAAGLRLRLLLCCCLLVQLLLCPAAGLGKEPAAHVADVALMNTEHELLLYFTVQDAITGEMEKGIENGIPVAFSFFVELYRRHPGPADTKIVSLAFDHTLTYDPLKQQYSVEMEEKEEPVSSFKSFAEAKWAMTNIHDLKLVDLALLEPDGGYTLKLKAKLAGKTLPLNFQHIIPFWQLWKFETDWHSLPFTYGNPGPATKR